LDGHEMQSFNKPESSSFSRYSLNTPKFEIGGGATNFSERYDNSSMEFSNAMLGSQQSGLRLFS